MTNTDHHIITVFEHRAIYTHQGEPRLSNTQLVALEAFHGEQGVPYFSLVKNGVKFNEYVGILQVGHTTYEILPKADTGRDTQTWRSVLIGMVKAVGFFDVKAPSSSHLRLKANTLLDVYFELFVVETEQLVHKGLVKKYRKTEANSHALKGALVLPKHLQANFNHKERFYVHYTTYDPQHNLNAILYKTLLLLQRLNNNPELDSQIGRLLLSFPEMADIRVNDKLFSDIAYSRKTSDYQTAIEIARLLLLNYHPDVNRGQHHVLALLFDMNVLWERFVYASLQKFKTPGIAIRPQTRKNFWKFDLNIRPVGIVPDIVINAGQDHCFILDTKWKHMNGGHPTPDDLRQLYTYTKYYQAGKALLIYPGEENIYLKGRFFDEYSGTIGMVNCGCVFLNVDPNISFWQRNLANYILDIVLLL